VHRPIAVSNIFCRTVLLTDRFFLVIVFLLLRPDANWTSRFPVDRNECSATRIPTSDRMAASSEARRKHRDPSWAITTDRVSGDVQRIPFGRYEKRAGTDGVVWRFGGVRTVERRTRSGLRTSGNIGCFNKGARFLNINKTSRVWDIHSIFLFERIFYDIKYGI